MPHRREHRRGARRPGDADVGRVTGDAVNTAARLETAAEPGDVLIGEATMALVRDAVGAEPVEPMSLKGKAGSSAPTGYVLPGPRSRHGAPLGDGRARLRELDDLRRAFSRAAEDRTCCSPCSAPRAKASLASSRSSSVPRAPRAS